MDRLEHELKLALQRKQPSADFDQRVAAAVRRRSPVFMMRRRWIASAAAAAVVVISGAGAGYRWHRGTVAKEQVLLAVKIAGGKLNRIQAQVREVQR
jgi:uncharacterized protein involved in tolerance to divalent cations